MILRKKSAMQFTDAFRLRNVRYGSTYCDDRIKELYTDDLPTTTHRGVRMLCSRKLKVYLVTLTQYGERLLDWKHGQVEELQTAPRRIRLRGRLRHRAVMTAIGETDSSTTGSQPKKQRRWN